MEEDIKCANCGGPMKRMDGDTMKCGSCGATKNVSENKGEPTEAVPGEEAK